MGKIGKKLGENHATKVTKISKTKTKIWNEQKKRNFLKIINL